MATGQQPVINMRRCENDRAANGENPVSHDAHLLVRYRGADYEQYHPGCGYPSDAQISMPRDADSDCHDAERQYQHQHLGMQMTFHEWQQHGKRAREQR